MEMHRNREFARRPSQYIQRANRLEILEPRLALTGDVFISEFQAVNRSTIADQDGDYSDWIEIQNIGTELVDLAGWYLTDDATDLPKWQLPAVSVAPNSRLLVFASNKDRTNANVELHTNFRLAADGEFLALVQPNGTVASEFGERFPAQLADVSFGLDDDGQRRFFTVPTPGEANQFDESFVNVAPEPELNLASGFYEDAISIEIVSPSPTAVVRYTLDSTIPTEQSPQYSGPITIDSTTIVRAASFEDGYFTASDATRSYLFLDDVLNQSGEGLPQTWGTFSRDFPLGPHREGDAVPANYDVDQDIVSDPRYSDTIKDDLNAIPSLSLIFEPDDLWSEETGIYSNTLDRGVEWERPVTAELIDTDGSIEFQVDAGTRIHGGFGRFPSATAKHSIRLAFKAEYGPTKLHYPWFGEDNAGEFDSIVLRASYNFSWARGERNNSQHGYDGTFLQDRWAAELQNEMGGLAPNGTWVHLYINGLYWGLYNPNERPDAAFQATYQGGVPEDYDVVKIGEVVDGNGEAWNELLELVRQDSIDYQSVQAMLDVPGFIDYMMINHFGGNEDWPYNNWYASRRREDGAQWQFHSWDAEFLFRDVNTNNVNERRDRVNNSPGEIYNRLRTVEAFRIEFGDRIQQHFFNEGLLTPAANIARLNSVAAPIDRAVVGESARWGDALFDNIDPAMTRDDHWLQRLDELRTEYFPQRTEIMLEQYRDIGLYPDVAAPTFNQHGGLVETSFELEVGAESGTIYYTINGADPRLPNGDINSQAIRYSQPVELPNNADVQARTLQNGNWSALVSANFIANTDLPLRITELMYHPADAEPGSPFDDNDFEFVEVTNIGAQTINPVGASFVNGIEFEFPSIELNAGERIVVVNNATAFRSRYGNEIRIAGEFSDGQLSNSGETIRLEDARGVPISELTYDDVAPWPTQADGSGGSIQVITPSLLGDDYAAPSNWRASSQLHGSPGASDDVDSTIAAIHARSNIDYFDFDRSGSVNDNDVTFLVENILRTRRGDVNLDGRVDFADFLVLSNNFGSANASWSKGDFDGDGIIAFSDFLILSSEFGFARELRDAS